MDALYDYYQLGVERGWAGQLDSNGWPTSNVYSNRFLDTINFINKKNNAKFSFLDVGCGIGIYSLNILKKFPNSRAFCFDLSKPQIAFAKKLFKEKGVSDRVSFFVGDAEKFKLDRKFDYILCTEVLEHLIHPEKAIHNIINCASEKTVLIFSVPYCSASTKEEWFYKQFSDSQKKLVDLSEKEIDKKKKYYKFFHKSFSFNDLQMLFEEGRLRIENYAYSSASFGNRYLNIGYNKISKKKIDRLFNKLTRNKFASQITFIAKLI